MAPEVENALYQMVILLAVTAVGYLCARLGYLDNRMREKLTALLLNIALPCMIVASAGDVDAASIGGRVALVFVLGVVQFFVLLATGALCNAACRTPRDERPLYLFMSVCTNTSFIGIPVAVAIYGDGVTVLCSVFIMAMSLLVNSVGVAALSPGGQGSWQHRAIDALRKAANPASAAAVVALVLVFADVQLPSVVEGTLDMVGGLTAPLAMLLVGVIVQGMRPREVLGEWRLYPFIAVRQVLMPAAMFFALSPFIDDALVLGLFIVMFAMPVGSMASMFAAQYGRPAALPAKGTVLSTAVAFPIVPALVALMAA